ncbi:MarR family winged helix-turn-helix transcriptional regulator [Microbacterium sp. YY-01]|uniref:MarR family winged helix-turn-helix transcriptional regulator n=1 Tax=Microbacterium sp. YY-01 TaxID=3421634 RepID=UPI003D16E791
MTEPAHRNATSGNAADNGASPSHVEGSDSDHRDEPRAARSAMSSRISDSERAEAVGALEAEFGELFSRVRRLYLDGAERVAPGLSPGAYKLLGMITWRAPVTPSDLAERTLSDRSQVSRAIRELENHGLVQREPDPHDRRSFLLTTTDEGVRRIKHSREVDAERMIRALDDWSLSDIRQLTHMLGALAQVIAAAPEPPAGPDTP